MITDKVFFIENSEFQKTLKSYFKKGSRVSDKEYAKKFEEYVAKIFRGNLEPRSSTTDTRPDIPLTSKDLPDIKTEDETIISFLEELRTNIASLESGDSFMKVRDAFIQAANTEKNPERKKAFLQTIGGIEIKASLNIDLVNGNIKRQTPRGLTGRVVLLGSALGSGALPEGGSLVIPIVSGILEKREGVKKDMKSIIAFFKKNKDDIHGAITGEYSGTDSSLLNFKSSAAVQQMRAKGQNLWLQYLVGSGKSYTSYSAYLPGSFTVANTYLKYIDIDKIGKKGFDGKLAVSYTTAFENRILRRLNDELVKKASNAANEIIKDTDLRTLLQSPPDVSNEIRVPSGGSIPVGNIKLPTKYIPRIDKSAFNSRIASVRKILRETKPYEESMGDFITNDTLTALTKREMLRRMPVGPVGGEPKSTRVLTFRTGTFVDSVKVFRDIRNQQISYYYSPNYWVHERTSRNPRNLIQSSIGSVAYALFAKRFNIVKSDASK